MLRQKLINQIFPCGLEDYVSNIPYNTSIEALEYLCKPHTVYYTPLNRIPYYKLESFYQEKGELDKKSEKNEQKTKKPILVRVLYSHGSSSNLFTIVEQMAFTLHCLRRKFDEFEVPAHIILIAWEYPGFSPLERSTDRFVLNKDILLMQRACEVYDLMRTLYADEKRILDVLWGFSLGTAPTCFLASYAKSQPNTCIILQAPFVGLLKNYKKFNGFVLEGLKWLMGDIDIFTNTYDHIMRRHPDSIVLIQAVSDDEILHFDMKVWGSIGGNSIVELFDPPKKHDWFVSSIGIERSIDSLLVVLKDDKFFIEKEASFLDLWDLEDSEEESKKKELQEVTLKTPIESPIDSLLDATLDIFSGSPVISEDSQIQENSEDSQIKNNSPVKTSLVPSTSPIPSGIID